MASSGARYIRRFSRSERAIHWVHASAFFVLLGSGLVLYLPSLSELASRRPLVKGIHIYTALAWAAALLLIAIVGDRRGLLRTLRELELFDADDRRWLLGRRAPQGRFNAGQKLNAALTVSFALLFAVSGFLLWYGERDTRFRFASTILLHDGLMYVSLVLLVGHLYLAVIHPKTRHALRGMTLGSVREGWALEHHAKWVETAAGLSLASAAGATLARASGRRAVASTARLEGARALVHRRGVWALATVLAALVALVLGISSVRRLLPGAGPAGSDFSAQAARMSQPPRLTRGLALLQHAVALDRAGRLDAAIPLYERAVKELPGRPDFRSLLGFALARAGRTDEALAELREAVRVDPSFAPGRLYLGALFLQEGRRAQARAELRRYLELAPVGQGAALARRLLRGT